MCCALASTCHGQCVHKIWSFYLWSFQRHKGVPKFRKWSRDRSHAPIGVKFSYFDKRRQAVYLPTKFGVRSFIRSKVMEGAPHFKFRSRDPDHAHCRGQFVVHWLVHVMVSVNTKNEVSIFGHSKDIKGVPKFRKWSRDLSPAALGVKFSYSTKCFTECISPQNLECVALSDRKLWRGPKF